MAVISLSGFAGENRRVHPSILPPNVGTISVNQKPGRGDLRAWKQPATVATAPAGRQTIYRMGRDVATPSLYWLSWPTVVHVVRGLVADDTTERTYYTGDGVPKVTNNTLALGAAPFPTSSRPLGLPRPTTAPAVAVQGAAPAPGATLTSYFYVYTFVNDWGWESAPSPLSVMVTKGPDQTVAITQLPDVLPAGNYNITALRVYRTQTGSSGATEFFFLREVAVGTTSTSDDNRQVQNQLETLDWGMPPADLSHLTALWNGMLAGISNGAVRFSETNVPYAWPPTYEVLPADSKPVALGVYGQNLVVLTNSRPVLVVGSTPDSMDSAPVEMLQACVAPRSVVSMGVGVAWASEDGLCWYGAGGPKILTEEVMSREDWRALVPSSIIGSQHEGLYFGSYDNGSGRKGFVLDPAQPGSIYFLSTGYTAYHFDELLDQLFVLNGANVQSWDAGASMTYIFRSKRFLMPAPTNFSCAQVIADSYVEGALTVRFFVDGTLRHTQAVTNRRGFRLPSGFVGDEWQIEVEGTAPVQSVILAHTMAELAAT